MIKLSITQQIVEFISVFYRKWNVDLYFIDWEQPKTICTPIQYCSPRTSLRKLFQGKLDLNESNDSGRKKTEIPSILKKKNIDDNSSSSSSEVLTMNEDVVQKLYQKAPVSIWRNFFIINEFYQLQTERKISVMFQIISTLFILEVNFFEKYMFLIENNDFYQILIFIAFIKLFR